jgi:drug/metabolite transporter (DMT)-like permease
MIGTGEVIALTSAAIWGTGILMYRVALRELSPLELTFIRSATAALFLVLAALVFGATPFGNLDLMDMILLVVSGILLFLGDICYFRCVGTIGIWIATPLSSVYPLFVAGIAYLFLGEGVTGLQLTGIIVIVLGIVVLTIKSPPGEGEDHDNFMLDSLMGLGAALFWATSLVALRYVLIDDGLFVATSSRSLIIIVILTLVLGTNGRLEELRHRKLSRNAKYLALISGAWGIGLGGLLFYYSMEFIGTARATAISATYPLFAGFLGTLLLGEKMTVQKVAGAILVVTGLMLMP